MSVSEMDDIERRVRAFVAKEIPWLRTDIGLDADLVRRARIDGADVFDLVINFSTEFAVDISDYRWYCHSGPEGCGLFHMIWFFRWFWKPIPIRLIDLIQSARIGKWCVRYPDAGDG